MKKSWSLLALGLALAGCNSDSTPGGDATGGVGGAVGGAGGAVGGTGGGGSGGGGSGGGGTGGGGTGGGGTAGTSGADAGGPSLDCTKEAGDYCIAVAGTMNGKPFTFTCLPANRDMVATTATRFALTCRDAPPTVTFRVAIPEKPAGTFDLPARETQAMVADLEMLKLTDEPAMAQMNSTAANLSDGRANVTFSADGLRVGTFEASWRAPDSGCRVFTYTCAQGSVRGSFRFRRP